MGGQLLAGLSAAQGLATRCRVYSVVLITIDQNVMETYMYTVSSMIRGALDG
jgi:hypothetical protein